MLTVTLALSWIIASEQAAYVGKPSQGRERDSNKGGKPWLKQPAAGKASQGGEAVEYTSSLPQEVQERGRESISWLPLPLQLGVLIQDTPSLTSSAFLLEVLFSRPGFQEQQQLRGAVQQLTSPFQ